MAFFGYYHCQPSNVLALTPLANCVRSIIRPGVAKPLKLKFRGQQSGGDGMDFYCTQFIPKSNLCFYWIEIQTITTNIMSYV